MGRTGRTIGRVAGNLISIVISLIVIIPLVVLFLNSFKTSAEANRMTLSLPTKWVFENYATVIEQGKLVSSFFNGLLYAAGSVIIVVGLVAAAAFVISRNQKGVNRFLYYFIISGIAMPINNVALMKVMQAFHLVNTRIGIILLYAAINIPLSLFLAYGFVATIPREIDEAAVIDGCKPWQLFLKVIAPLLKPIVSTLFVLDFMAIALGAKDEWPDYPYMEFMPALEGGNGQNWNDMAKTDTPFSEGSDINKAYTKVNELFHMNVFGKDPLGMGNDQVTALFAQKKAAILALGDWGLQNIQTGTDDYSELGTFYLPVRNTTDDPFRVIVQGDSFMGVTTHSKNPELAKAFVEWFYSEDWYPGYISYVTSASSMTNFPKEKDPILAEADALQPDMELVMYDGGGDDFQAIQNEIAFDYKKLGAQMFTEGFDLKTELDTLNTKWAEARTKLGIK